MGIGFLNLSAQSFIKGSVVAMSTFTVNLKPNVTMDQFIDFYTNKYIPANDKVYPGTRTYLFWGDRGDRKNQIGLVWIFESVAVRDKYFPNEGSTGSEAVLAAEEKLKAMNEEFDKYAALSDRIYTDWLVK